MIVLHSLVVQRSRAGTLFFVRKITQIHANFLDAAVRELHCNDRKTCLWEIRSFIRTINIMSNFCRGKKDGFFPAELHRKTNICRSSVVPAVFVPADFFFAVRIKNKGREKHAVVPFAPFCGFAKIAKFYFSGGWSSTLSSFRCGTPGFRYSSGTRYFFCSSLSFALSLAVISSVPGSP